MAEHSAVNRRVVSSSLTCGANFVEDVCTGVLSRFENVNSMFWVYVLENERGMFYVGQTGDIDRRLIDHNLTDSFEGHFTRKNGPWKLVWSEQHASRGSAIKRERQIKRMKSAIWIRTLLLARSDSAVNPDESGL